MRFILIFIIAFCFSSCENFLSEDFFTIGLDNNSGKPVKYRLGLEESQMIYPDTLLPQEKPTLSNLTENTFISSRVMWQERIDNLQNDTLSIYFFDPNTLDIVDYSLIRSEYKILKRYDLSIEDLESLNFSIEYPPTQEMNSIRMFPPE